MQYTVRNRRVYTMPFNSQLWNFWLDYGPLAGFVVGVHIFMLVTIIPEV